MAAILLFANNALSTLAGPLSPASTTCQLAAGTGILFPNPAPNQFFKLTFTDAATGFTTEICHCTARNGDVLTIVRGQENTVPNTWAAGDHADNLLTAGTLLLFAQLAAVSSSFYQGTAGGTANDLTVDSTAPANNAPSAGQLFVVTKNNNDNTGAVTAKIPTIGGQQLSVVYADGSALSAHDWPANSAALLYFTGGVYQFVGVLQSPGARIYGASDAGVQASPNAIVVTATQPAAGLNVLPGQTYAITKNNYGNTGPMTFKTTPMPAALPIVWPDGSALLAGDWPANSPAFVTITATAAVLLTQPNYFARHQIDTAVTAAGVPAAAPALNALAEAQTRAATAGTFGVVDASSTANTIVLNANGTFIMPTALSDGERIWFVPALKNTGNTTVKAFGGLTKPLYDPQGNQLLGGELVPNLPVDLRYSATLGGWQMLPWALGAASRSVLSVSGPTGVSTGSWQGLLNFASVVPNLSRGTTFNNSTGTITIGPNDAGQSLSMLSCELVDGNATLLAVRITKNGNEIATSQDASGPTGAKRAATPHLGAFGAGDNIQAQVFVSTTTPGAANFNLALFSFAKQG